MHQILHEMLNNHTKYRVWWKGSGLTLLTQEVFPRIRGSLLEECLQSHCFGVVRFSGHSCCKALVGTGSVLWHWARLKPSADELNICNFFKLEIYHQFYLFHNGGVQTSRADAFQIITYSLIIVSPLLLWVGGLSGAAPASAPQITQTSAHVLHTLNLPLFSSQFLQFPCESLALH